MERLGFFGAHEAVLNRYIGAQLRRGDWVIDVGANVGLISSVMAAAVGPEGAVWAFEPLPRNVERLRALKEANNLTQLTIFPLGLSSTASTAKLLLSPPEGGSGSGSFVSPWAKEGYIEVEVNRLDDLVEADGEDLPLRLVKIDVEGFEPEVLAGAKNTLTTKRPLILCEFHDPLLLAAGSSSEALLDQFSRYGFHPGPPFGRPPGPLDGRVVDMLLIPDSVQLRSDQD